MQYFKTCAAVAGLLALVGCDDVTAFNNITVSLTDKQEVTFDLTGTRGETTTTSVKGNPNAARLSERTTRKVSVLKTPFLHADSGLELTVKSYNVTSDDSWVKGSSTWDYTRTSYTIKNTTSNPIALDAITLLNGSLPFQTVETIGNTDGAVLFGKVENGPYAWGAIEHPMARYTVTSGTAATTRAVPMKTTYTIADLTNRSNLNGSFEVPVTVTAVPMSLTVTYQSGNLRAALYGVEAIAPATGNVLDADRHEGTTGGVSKANTYTLNNLTVGQTVVLKVAAGTDGSGTSNGILTLTGATPADGVTLTTPACPATVKGWVPVVDTLQPGATMTFSYTFGFFRERDQFRRVFNEYLNAERAHPHRVLPHYNNWYDLGINRNDLPVEKRFTREEALESMRAFRTELWEKRGVFINSYLWDDGWDNWDSLWGFNENFPNGFTELAEEAHKVPGATIACWMSPFGGYGGSYVRRVSYAKKHDIIDRNASGLQLSKPTYYAAFRDRVLQMINDYDMNLFKFDRMGSGSDANGAAPRYAADLRAVGDLCAEMRAAKRDIFINCTVGTWGSPFWLMWCDSIWKGDGDCDWLGSVGTQRQKWVTYRDNIIHDRIASKSPLFPMNSMMMHGIIVCKSSPHNTMRDYKGTGSYQYDGESYATPTACADFAAEVWMGVALGTGLQEYYISPKLMSKTWWDILANGVKWLKANETVLTDSHWVGGDPGAGADMQKRGNEPKDIYGFASLGIEKGIVILRNPSNKPQDIAVNLDALLEMPEAGRAATYTPTVVFNSTTAYENAGKPGAFQPVWPATTADTVTWTLPPFATILFEIAR
ncbi:MAG: hypothetical protein IJV69_01005 [Kiritimatiellae bacterium]|nr:hypothetical protein [Kiritimatiellia bacterium]